MLLVDFSYSPAPYWPGIERLPAASARASREVALSVYGETLAEGVSAIFSFRPVSRRFDNLLNKSLY